MPPLDAPLRVLLCEDDAILSSALAMLIDYQPEMEMVTAPVRTGQSAVDGVARHRPDVVLMDVNLEGPMDGFQATVLIKEAVPATAVVIMSGMPNLHGAATDARSAGAFSFLAKSHTPREIVDTLRAAGQATRAAMAGEPPAAA